jgi:hypothetical protein
VERIVERPGALDVHNASVTACVRICPGRKTDVLDSQWLCQLLEAGLLRASFVPSKPIRTLRNLAPYRKTQINDRQRQSSRLDKILEDTGIKLSCVASDILGKSGRDMLDALVSCTTDPVVLADLARGQLRKKLPVLQEALVGRFEDEHTLVVGQILAHIDFLDEAIDRLSGEIEERVRPFAAQRDLLMTIPRRQATRRRGADLRDRRRHERVPYPQGLRLVGEDVPRQRPVRRQTPVRDQTPRHAPTSRSSPLTRFRFRHTVSPRYQNSIGGTMVGFDDARATGRVHRPKRAATPLANALRHRRRR